jgi:curved DNA-binding protein CbpA
MADYYQLLGITKDASEAEIRAAYRRQAKIYHPDLNKSPDAHSRFIVITNAYETLIDSDRRHRYNQRFSSTPRSSMEAYNDWLKAQKERAEHEAKMRYYEHLRNREKFRQSKYYNLAIIVTQIARFVCYSFGVAIIAVCLFLIIDFHFMLLFFLLPFICGGVFLIKWANDWYQETRRYF